MGFFLSSILLSSSPASRAPSEPVNAILGDASWVAAHGEAPNGAPDVDRIRTHLLFVEARLRAADVRRFEPAARRRRAHLLDVLHAYAEAGVFPQHDHPSVRARIPRFVDTAGRLCAVGHLIAFTEGREVADRLGAVHEYERIMEIDEPLLDAWARAHGFTRLELAMIQPSYPPPPPPHSRRGLAWSVRALMPIVVSDIEMADRNRLAFTPVGGGAEGSCGYQLDCGLALMLTGGLTAHDALTSGVLTTVRTALTGLWTIEVGSSSLVPEIGVSAGLLLAATDDTGLRATGFGNVLVGARFKLSRWMSIDAAIALEGALPGAAFANAIAWVTPSLALTLGEIDGGYGIPSA